MSTHAGGRTRVAGAGSRIAPVRASTDVPALRTRLGEIDRQLARINPTDPYLAELARYFPGGRVGGSGRGGARLNARREASVDRAVAAAKRSEPLHVEANAIRSRLADLESGRAATRAEATQSRAERVRAAKVGDEVIDSAYGRATVVRVNAKTLTIQTASGYKEARPYSLITDVVSKMTERAAAPKPPAESKPTSTRAPSVTARATALDAAYRAARAETQRAVDNPKSSMHFHNALQAENAAKAERDAYLASLSDKQRATAERAIARTSKATEGGITAKLTGAAKAAKTPQAAQADKIAKAEEGVRRAQAQANDALRVVRENSAAALRAGSVTGAVPYGHAADEQRAANRALRIAQTRLANLKKAAS